jgi:hypothetical protein
MVGMTLCFSVVARMKIAYGGGSSSVLRNALNAALDNMCTSSIMYTLYTSELWWIPHLVYQIPDILNRIIGSGIEFIYIERIAPAFSRDSSNLLTSRASIRAQVVLPTPRGPQNSMAWAGLSVVLSAFCSVVVICSCPTTSANPFRAGTCAPKRHNCP